MVSATISAMTTFGCLPNHSLISVIYPPDKRHAKPGKKKNTKNQNSTHSSELTSFTHLVNPFVHLGADLENGLNDR